MMSIKKLLRKEKQSCGIWKNKVVCLEEKK